MYLYIYTEASTPDYPRRIYYRAALCQSDNIMTKENVLLKYTVP